MRWDKLQRRILILLLILCILTPVGLMLPIYFDAGKAWGEWSAATLKDLIGYVPRGLEKYASLWKAPLADYTFNSKDVSIVHQSGY